MAENDMKFEVGARVNVDGRKDVPVVALKCALCLAEGKTEAVTTPATRVWVPALFERWIPKWEREKFMSLEDAILKAPALAALIQERKGRKEASRLCADHGKTLRTARIWTDQLFQVVARQQAAADKKAAEAFNSIGASLAGKKLQAAADLAAQGDEPEGEDAAAQARREQEEIQRRTLAASLKSGQDAAEAAEAEGKSQPKGKKAKGKPRGSTKGRSKGKLQGEIDEALGEGDES